MSAPPPTPRHAREEYVEQAYFFRALRQRLADGWPTQQTLAQLREELLSTTRMPLAAEMLLDHVERGGELGGGLARLPHYFTPFQTHVTMRSEADRSRFTFGQALLILEREAEYKSTTATPNGLFFYQLETLTRNQLGYLDGLIAMEGDGFFDDGWRRYCGFVRTQLGEHDFAELVYLRSELYVRERQRNEPDYQPRSAPLFGEKEGRIAAANRGRDPNYLFSALQRHLGFPPVPRPPKASDEQQKLDDTVRRLAALEQKLKIVEGEVFGKTDPAMFMAKPKGP